MNLEFVDRTKKDGFILYFKMRPEHFEEIFLEEATIENISWLENRAKVDIDQNEWELMKTRINEYF